MAQIQTFVVFDLEATGLPHQAEDYPVRIMEVSMVAVQRLDHVGGWPERAAATATAVTAAAEVATLPPGDRGLTTPKRPLRPDGGGQRRGGTKRSARPAEPATPDAAPLGPCFSPLPALPRVRNALLLAVNPCKQVPDRVSELTGLDNELLEGQGGFDAALIDMLHGYLRRLPPPVCLVAHNGNRYDFPLLLAELKHAGATWAEGMDLKCADTLVFFREMQAEAKAAAAKAGDAAAEAGAGAGDGESRDSAYTLDDSTLCCRHGHADAACIVCNPGLFDDFDRCDTNTKYAITRVGGRRAVRCQHVAGDTCLVCENVPHYRRGQEPPPPARRALFSPADKPRRSAPSLKLPDVYKRRFGLPPERGHCAGDDVDALLMLCLSHGEGFFAWADANCQPLAGVKEMWQRRRQGKQRAA